MATPASDLREVIHDRWRMASTSAVLCDHAPGHPSEGNSKPMRRLVRSLEVLTGRLLEDGLHSQEEPDWDRFQTRLLNTIEEMATEYAFQVETARAARRENVA